MKIKILPSRETNYNKRLLCNIQNRFGLIDLVWRKSQAPLCEQALLVRFWFSFKCDTGSGTCHLCLTNTTTKSQQLGSQAQDCAGTTAGRGNASPQGTQWSTRHRISSFLFTKENKQKKSKCLLLYPSSLESSFKIKNNS